MTVQPSLPGFDDTPAPTDRLFFALFPPPEVAAAIEQVAQQTQHAHGLRGARVEAPRLHVTLHHLGDFDGLPAGVLASARRAGAAVAESAFDLGFDRLMSFHSGPSKRPLVLRGEAGMAGVIAFQRALGKAMALEGLGRMVAPSFTPHVTLLYAKQLLTEHAIEPIGWTAREFVLVHSLLGRHEHIPLARWSLEGVRG